MAETTAVKIVALPSIVDLDALDIVRVSTNALFMLVSAAETARRNNFPFAISGPSAPVLTAIDRLGLGESFSGLMKG